MKITSKKPKRTGLSQKIRFEVFKRDSFRCQYCDKVRSQVMRAWPKANKGWVMAILRRAYEACGDVDMVTDACLTAVENCEYYSNWVGEMDAWIGVEVPQ